MFTIFVLGKYMISNCIGFCVAVLGLGANSTTFPILLPILSLAMMIKEMMLMQFYTAFLMDETVFPLDLDRLEMVRTLDSMPGPRWGRPDCS